MNKEFSKKQTFRWQVELKILEELDKIYNLLLRYIEQVQTVNLILSNKYNIDFSVFEGYRRKIIPRKGEFEYDGFLFEFQFHGKGLFAKYKEVAADFDYFSPDWRYDIIQSLSFIDFIKQFEDYQTIENSFVLEQLEGHNKNGLLMKTDHSNSSYQLLQYRLEE